VETRLTVWASTAHAQTQAALTSGGLDGVVRRWRVERERLMTILLMEAIDG
jgi:hypothetical protein